ncbi:MAG TPA: AMP phosphorylase [Candidatus Nanopusillus sp.]|nr:AMP phosphorylase [Candidatus Nanopusillus sp.]HIP90353.1 AMP phosphorylase [Candidatus Nanopusillus sp.]
MFKVRKLPIHAGINIAVLNPKDARKLGVNVSDRILIKKEDISRVAVVDFDATGSIIKEGEVGIFHDIEEFSDGERVEILPYSLPESVRYIRKKQRGLELTEYEIKKVVEDVYYDRLLPIEIASYLTAIQAVGMSINEIISLTKAMVEIGKQIEWPKDWIVVDKHSIGGIPNNRTTPIVVPIVAALGLKIPKTSSRAITSPAGTADVIEVLAPVEFDIDEIKEIVSKVNGCMVWGGALDISPVDDKLIRIERSLGLDPEGQVVASVLSKKKAMGSKYVIIDIPYGEHAKVKTLDKAELMAFKFKKVGESLGMKIKAVITNGFQPIGNGVGPVLEIIDLLKILRNERDAPKDLKEKGVELAGKLLELVGRGDYNTARAVLESGKAFEKFKEIIEEQGGSVDRDLYSMLGQYTYDVVSPVDGYVEKIINTYVAQAARLLGAPEYKGVGLYLFKKVGYKVKKGEKLLRIYATSESKLDLVLDYLKSNFPYIIRSRMKFIINEI